MVSKTRKSKSGGSSASKGASQKYVILTKNQDKRILDNLDYDGGPEPVSEEVAIEQKENNDSSKSPSPYSAFKLLMSARFAAALWTTISDCDETFNYWEPTHYLLRGRGFQTWEYSPIYALRSYMYLMLFAAPAKIYDMLLSPTPLLLFFFIRCFFAFISSSCETYLYKAVRKRFGGNIGRIYLICSLFSAGMFISSTAYLPSSFSGYMTMASFGAWLNGRIELSIFFVALSALLSWPFAALTGVMIALDILLVRRQLFIFVKWSLISASVILIPSIAMDSYFYGKLVITPYNLLLYNVFSDKGPDLYGTEPLSFYFVNGILNFNIMFLAAISSAPVLFIVRNLTNRIWDKTVIILTFYVWLLVFSFQPHKEERFLFPIFPLICLGGAISVDSIQKLVDLICAKLFLLSIRGKKDLHHMKIFDYRRIVAALGVCTILTSSFIGCSRILALHYGYRAPFDVYFQLHREPSFQEAIKSGKHYTICYGKEWHRFPNHFFMPTSNWDVRFVQSDFKGQLPSLYAASRNATRIIPVDMNDENKEVPGRYVDLTLCDYLVDLMDEDQLSPLQPMYGSMRDDWKILSEHNFLISLKSHSLFRAFYFPFLSEQKTTYRPYVFLERVKKKALQKGKEFDEDDLLE